MAEVYAAELNGMPLAIETIDDGFEKSIVRHEFPHKNGAELEDMGLKARVIRFRCYFYGENYEYHKDLLAWLDDAEVFELQHPIYGIINGSIESVSVRHDDREETAEIDLTFVETIAEIAEPTPLADVETEIEETYEEGQEEATAELADDIGDDLGTEAESLLDRTLDAGQTILEQFTDITGAVRDYVSQIDSFVNTLQATLQDITNPINSLIASINYLTDLPGTVIKSIAEVVERYSLAYETIKEAPALFVQSFVDGIAALKASLPQSSSNSSEQAAIDTIQKQITIGAAQRLALDLSSIYSEDEALRQVQKKIEDTKSFDAKGNYIRQTAIEPIMAIGEIEETLAASREQIQTAVDSARSMQSLKTLGRQLLDHVNEIKLEREKMIQVDINNEVPLHLICLKYGLPYNTAERIHAVNIIANPSFYTGEVSIYQK